MGEHQIREHRIREHHLPEHHTRRYHVLGLLVILLLFAGCVPGAVQPVTGQATLQTKPNVTNATPPTQDVLPAAPQTRGGTPAAPRNVTPAKAVPHGAQLAQPGAAAPTKQPLVKKPEPRTLASVREAVRNATSVVTLPLLNGTTPNKRDALVPDMRKYYNYYGTSNVDILEIRNQSDYYYDPTSFKRLVSAYANKTWAGTLNRLNAAGRMYKVEGSHELHTLTLENGIAYEHIQKARRSRLYRADNGKTFPQLIDPYSSTVFYVPCPPNYVLQVWPSGTSWMSMRSWTTTDKELYDDSLSDAIKLYAISGQALSDKLLALCK